jgi:hypothetical protein
MTIYENAHAHAHDNICDSTSAAKVFFGSTSILPGTRIASRNGHIPNWVTAVFPVAAVHTLSIHVPAHCTNLTIERIFDASSRSTRNRVIGYQNTLQVLPQDDEDDNNSRAIVEKA